MRLIRLILINIKRQMKNPLIISMIFIMPVIMILLLNGGGFGGSSGEIGIIDKSKSKYSAELVDKISEEYSIEILNEEAESHFNLLREQKLGLIYVIDSDFAENLQAGVTPKIKCYETESTNGSLMSDYIINQYISGIMEEGISSGLSTNSIKAQVIDNDTVNNDSYRMTVIMICYFMMIGGSIIAEEILRLKKQKVLRRTIATSNSDKTILGSLFISSFIIQGGLSSLAFIVLTLVMDIPNSNVIKGILVLFLSSLISTSIIVVITRWAKNGTLASLLSVAFGLITFGIAMLASNLEAFENAPRVISKIAIISPFTWLLRIIDGGDILVPTLVIILMSAVFFTAGSFKLREFVKE